MSEKEKKTTPPEDAAEQSPETVTEQGAAAEGQTAAASDPAALEAELEAARDAYLRLAAEYDNFRKRTAREREQIHADAYSAAITAFLPVIDNLDRASAHSADEGDGLRCGIDLIIKQLASTLEKLEIREINPINEAFDPELHDAVMHVEDETKGQGQVAEVLQKGYTLGDRVIRHAMVKVAN